MKKKNFLPPLALLLAVLWSGCPFAGPGKALAQAPDKVLAAGTDSSQAGSEERAAATLVRPGETLTLTRVVEIARSRQPEILAARAEVQAGASRVGLARAGYYPQVDGLAGYSRISPAAGSLSTAGMGNGSFDYYSAEITASQMLFDFGRTKTRVEISKSGLDSSRADLADVEEQVVFAATLAYYDLLKTMRNREVAAERVRQFAQHLEQAQGFFQAGIKPRYDVTRAEVDLSNARLDLTRAENSRELARVALNNAMGLSEAPPYEVEDDLGLRLFELPLESALAKAEEGRADLKALLLKKRLAAQELLLAGKGSRPTLAGNAGAGYSGENFPLDEGWNVGVALSFPIFNGHQTRYRVEEARAGLNRLTANENSLRLAIGREVRQSYLMLQEAAERVRASELILRQAEENHELATGRYRAGVGNPVELADADAILVNARTGHIQALYDHRLSVAAMERATGWLMGQGSAD